MKHFEYKLFATQDLPRHGFMGVKGPTREEIERYLDDLGRDGWEIVDIDFGHVHTWNLMWSFHGVAKRETT